MGDNGRALEGQQVGLLRVGVGVGVGGQVGEGLLRLH
jgi:hypothetical protein